MNPNMVFFWKSYLQLYFSNKIPKRLSCSNSGTNAVLSGVTVDLDLLIPCNPENLEPIDIKEDYRLARLCAENMKEYFSKIMYHKDTYTPANKEKDLWYVV